MSNYEILLAEDEARLGSALEVTRKMRRAALGVQGEGLSGNATQAKEQSILRDAERLAVAAAAVAIRSKRDEATHIIPNAVELDERRAKFDRELARSVESYGQHKPLVFARIGRDFRALLERMNNNLQDVLELEYREKNNIPLPIDQLMSHRVGVLAPLSSDYMMAEIQRAYLESQGHATFAVKPVVIDRLDETGERAILPLSRRGRQSFAGKREIVLYVDAPGMGLTSRALWLAAQRGYSEKTIHGKGSRPIDRIIYDQVRRTAARRPR